MTIDDYLTAEQILELDDGIPTNQCHKCDALKPEASFYIRGSFERTQTNIDEYLTAEQILECDEVE